MRVAALYDIHGNLPALEAVLADLEHERPDLIVCGGDVAWGPMPSQTIDCLRDLGDRVRFVMGNCDREMVTAFDAGAADDEEHDQAGRWTSWCARRLRPDQRDFMAGFAPLVTVTVDGLGPTLFCHGSPRRDDEIITALSGEARLGPMLDGLEQDVVVCGHTHVQFDRQVLGRRVINAGAVGLPYQGTPGAFWVLLGPGVAMRSTRYDLEAAVARMAEGGFQELDELLRESLLEPVQAAEVSSFFERRATAG